jgi:hypothetical protein
MTDTTAKILSATELDVLAEFAAKINKFGANFAAFDQDATCIMDCPAGRFDSDLEQIARYILTICQQQSDSVHRLGTYNEVLAVPLKASDETVAIAVIDTGDIGFADSEDMRRFCSQHGIDYVLLEKAVKPNKRDNDYLAEMLLSFAEQFKTASKTTQQLEKVGTELSRTYEELMLLYNMSTSTKVTQSNATYLQMACPTPHTFKWHATRLHRW